MQFGLVNAGHHDLIRLALIALIVEAWLGDRNRASAAPFFENASAHPT
jgi:hypothetical protein